MVKDRSCRVARQKEIRMQGLIQQSNWAPWIHKKSDRGKDAIRNHNLRSGGEVEN